MNKKKLIKALLAGSMAFGVVGTAALADLPGLKAEQAEAAMLWTYVYADSYSVNTLDHQMEFKTDTTFNHMGRTANWYIKDVNGTIKLQGTSVVDYAFASEPNQWSTATVKTSISSLPAGNYELLYTYTAGETVRSTRAFTKNADGTVKTYY